MSDPSTAVAAAPLIELARPYIDVAVQAIVVGFVGLGFALLNKYTGIAVNSQAIDRLKSAAATQAGILVAGAEDNLAGRSIDVDSPGIASAAAAIEAGLPEAFALTGATPDKLKSFVVGEIGKLQAAQGAPAAK